MMYANFPGISPLSLNIHELYLPIIHLALGIFFLHFRGIEPEEVPPQQKWDSWRRYSASEVSNCLKREKKYVYKNHGN